MRYLLIFAWTLVFGGALFAVLFGGSSVTYTAVGPFAPQENSQTAMISFAVAPNFSIFDSVLKQLRGVTSFAAQAIGAVTQINLEDIRGEEAPTDDDVLVVDETGGFPLSPGNGFDAGGLLINIPLAIDNLFSVAGESALSTTTINGSFVVIGDASVLSLISEGLISAPRASLGTLTASSLRVSGAGSVGGVFTAEGGIETDGADINLGLGELFASNVVNEIIAGDSIRVSGPRTSPTISFDADFDMVQSLNGEDGKLELEEGTDISIDGLEIDNTSTLSSVRGRGGCDSCITDEDVADALSLLNGTVNGTPIGLSSAAFAAFTDVVIGTTSATSTLSVNGDASIDGLFEVVGTATSTFAGSINVTSGCVAVNNVCLGGADRLVDLTDVSASSTVFGDLLQFDGSDWVNVSTSSLGLADTFLELSDTPSSYIANALLYADASATSLTQSANLVFTGIGLGIGTSSPLEMLSVNGNFGVHDGNDVRLYTFDNTAYAGFRASSTLASSVIWSLPISDGASDEILVTDGLGNLRFADVSSIGGGSETFIGLDDTPSAYIDNAIPYASTTDELLFSADLVFDGTNLGIGTSLPTSELTVQGSVRFEADASTPGLVYDVAANKVGIGTDAPSELLTLEGGTFLQRGGSLGNTYTPQQIGSLNLPDNGNDVEVVGLFAYVVNGSAGNEFRVINVGDPGTPALVGSVNLPVSANALAVSGKYAYVVTDVSVSEFQVINITNPALPAVVATANLSTTAFDVFIQGTYAYVVTGGTGDDFHIIDISNPLAPREVGSLDFPAGLNAVHVSGDYAYVGMNTLGDEFRVINIRVPQAPVVVDTLDLPTTVNDVFVDGNYAYAVSSSAGDDFHVIDISNPASVSEVGSVNFSGTAHGVRVAGQYAYVATAGASDSFAVVDILDPNAPALIGTLGLAAGTALSLDVSGTHAYVVTSSAGDDLHVIDITGVNAQSLFAHALGAGSLSLTGDALISGAAVVSNSLRVGAGGVQTDGALYAQGTSTSFFLGKLGIGTTTSNNLFSLYSASGDASIELGASSGSSYRWTMGLDQSDGYKFKISSSTVLGTNDRLVIDGSGRVGIGTSTPAEQLVVGGTIQSTDLLGGATNLTTDASGNIIRDPSDRRLKTDIQTIDGALDTLLQLRGVSYKWKDEDRFGDQTEIGFIAQEVDLILPEVVRKGGEYWSLNTRNILAVVIEGFKEMWVVVQGNTQKIEMLESRVEELEAELNIDSPDESAEGGTEETEDSEVLENEASESSDNASSTSDVVEIPTETLENEPQSEDGGAEEGTDAETESAQEDEVQSTENEDNTTE